MTDYTFPFPFKFIVTNIGVIVTFSDFNTVNSSIEMEMNRNLSWKTSFNAKLYYEWVFVPKDVLYILFPRGEVMILDISVTKLGLIITKIASFISKENKIVVLVTYIRNGSRLK
jgi:hypothetical protein